MCNIFLSLSLAVVTLTSFSEAAQAGNCNKRNRDEQVAGAIIGGIIGGVIGHQIGGGRGNDVATVVGAIGGAMIGGEIGCEMGNEEYYEINRVRSANFDSGYNSPYRWRTQRFQGDIMYTRSGYIVYQRSRIVCRDYQSVVYYGGRQEVTNGTVCRFPDGSVRDVQNVQVYYDSVTSYPPPVQNYPPHQRPRDHYANLLNDYEMQDFVNMVARASFDSEKTSIVSSMSNMYLNQRRSLTLSQATSILRLMSFDSGKLQALKTLKPLILPNSGSLDEALQVFSFSSSRSEALRILTSY